MFGVSQRVVEGFWCFVQRHRALWAMNPKSQNTIPREALLHPHALNLCYFPEGEPSTGHFLAHDKSFQRKDRNKNHKNQRLQIPSSRFCCTTLPLSIEARASLERRPSKSPLWITRCNARKWGWGVIEALMS